MFKKLVLFTCLLTGYQCCAMESDSDNSDIAASTAIIEKFNVRLSDSSSEDSDFSPLLAINFEENDSKDSEQCSSSSCDSSDELHADLAQCFLEKYGDKFKPPTLPNSGLCK